MGFHRQQIVDLTSGSEMVGLTNQKVLKNGRFKQQSNDHSSFGIYEMTIDMNSQVINNQNI